MGIPLSTKIKDDNAYYVKYKFRGDMGSALISQIRVLDTKRITDYIGRLDELEFQKIQKEVLSMLGDSYKAI